MNSAEKTTYHESVSNVIRKTPRGQLLVVIAREGLLTIPELVELTTLNAKQIRDNAGAARAEGLLTSKRDDVTGGVGFQITDAGRGWLKSRGIDPTKFQTHQDDTPASAPEEADPEADEPSPTDQEPTTESPVDEPPETPAQPDDDIVQIDGQDIWAILDLTDVLAIAGDESHAREITRRHCQETGEPAILYRLTPICKAVATVEMQDL